MKRTRWSKAAFECQECGEWHDLTDDDTEVAEVEGWLCNACGEFHEGDPPDPQAVVFTDGREYLPLVEVEGLTAQMYECPATEDWAGDPTPTSYWRLPCENLVEDEPDVGPAWECGECETVYGDEDKDAARECCQE